MKTRLTTWSLLGLFTAATVGCIGQSTTQTVAVPDTATADDDFVLASEPDGAKSVIETREAAKDQDEVVIVGRIGGSENPWIEGRAAFSIVDGTLKACSDIPGDDCPVPWDYCCETDKLPTSKALVKFVDNDGQVVKQDARQLLNVKELQTVVVRGQAQRDDAGNLTILANGVFIRN